MSWIVKPCVNSRGRLGFGRIPEFCRAGNVSVFVVWLVDGACNAMMLVRLKMALASLLVLCGSAGSYALLVQEKPATSAAAASQSRNEIIPGAIIRQGNVIEFEFNSNDSTIAADSKRVPILDSAPTGRDFADNPPTLADLLAESPDLKSLSIVELSIRTEKILDKVDACKVYPLAGPCHLVHKHYQAVIRVGNSTGKNRAEERTVYIEQDYLVRCLEQSRDHKAHRAVANEPSSVNDTLEQPVQQKSEKSHIEDVEKKLVDVLKTLEELKNKIER